MNELISIVVPVYKVEPYLNRCVDSIICQSYKMLEIILVDDESPDGCGEICNEYIKIDKRIKVIHKKTGGLSDARNVGIDITQGRYITFVDSDDWIHEKYIEKLYQLLVDTCSDISVCNHIKTSTENCLANLDSEEYYECSNILGLEQLYGEYNCEIVPAWGKLYKIQLFENIRFPVGRIHEDEFTTYKLIYTAEKIVMTKNELLYYWQREDSIMGRNLNLRI